VDPHPQPVHQQLVDDDALPVNANYDAITSAAHTGGAQRFVSIETARSRKYLTHRRGTALSAQFSPAVW
jgi:hypothetical protein